MTANAHGDEGDRLLDAGQVGSAIREYRRALRLEPASAWWHQALAVAVGRKGWFVAARSFFCQALRLDPEAVARWYDAHPWRFSSPAAIPDPVFVLGCPHSGTTILTRLIAGHPEHEWAETRETHVFTRPPAEVESRLARWDAECTAHGKRRWVEKSVIHSFQVPWLRDARPGARFVVSVRDGRDVFCSTKARGDHRSVQALIEQWVFFNLVLSRHRGDAAFLFVRYEDLVSQREATLRAVCDHVGAEFTPALLKDPREATPPAQVPLPADQPTAREAHRRYRHWQVRQPFFDGRGRWREEMQPEDKEAFKRAAQDDLVALGYASSDDW